MKTIFLDRDGVINKDVIGGYITKPKDFKILPFVLTGLRELQWKGYRLILISNQAGVGDKVYRAEQLEAVTERMCRLLSDSAIRLDGIYYCTHGKTEGCGCRKPAKGLFLRAANDFSVDRSRSFYICDKRTDVIAAQDFGVRTIMVRTGHGASEAKKLTVRGPDFLVDDFQEAVQIILTGESSRWPRS